MKRFRAEGLQGEQGLLAAVIARALRDLKSRDKLIRLSAEFYFRGPVYQQHLQELGLPAGTLPAELSGDKRMTKRLTRAEAQRKMDSVIRLHADIHNMTYDEAFASLQERRPELLDAYVAHQRGTGQKERQGQYALNAKIKRYAKKHGVDYITAFEAIQKGQS